MLRTAAIPIDLIDAVTNYVGRAPQVRNFDIVDDAAWALLPESKEEWLYGGIAAIFTSDEAADALLSKSPETISRNAYVYYTS